MIKLLHTADLHLDSPLASLALRDEGLRDRVENATRAALGNIVQIAIDEAVAAVLIAGDLYDGSQRSMKTAAYLRAALVRLGEAGIRVFVIRGNHDAESTITRDIEWPDNVHVFDGHGGHVMLTDQIAIHGVSFRERVAPDSLVPKYRPVAGAVNIALLHSSVAGAAGHDPYAPCTLGDLVAAGFEYWALGHIHKRIVYATAPHIVMPGMPQGRDMGEDGPKSATLITVSEAGIKIAERATAVLTFERGCLDVSDCADLGAVQDAISRWVRGQSGAVDRVLRLTLAGQTPLNWHIRRDADLLRSVAEDAAATAGDLWIDRLEIATTQPDETAEAGGAGEEMAAFLTELAAAPSLPDEALAVLRELITDLPADLRDHWGADEATQAAAASDLVARARDWAIAQLQSGAPEPTDDG